MTDIRVKQGTYLWYPVMIIEDNVSIKDAKDYMKNFYFDKVIISSAIKHDGKIMFKMR